MRIPFLSIYRILLAILLASVKLNCYSQVNVVEQAKIKFYQYAPKIEASKGGKLDNIKVIEGDFTNDGLDDIIIQFTIVTDGGAGHILGVGAAFYKNINRRDVKVIGGYEPGCIFRIDKIQNNVVYITKSYFKNSDPFCCPSIHKRVRVKYMDSQILEF